MGWTERELLERTAWMRHLARGLTRGAHQADDLVQDAWVAALESGERPRAPRAWFRAVLGNRHSSELRARERRADRERRAARGAGLPQADEAAQRVELQEQLARAVFALDEPYRQALALRYFQGWPPRRIAAELGLDARAVEARLRRGLERLRRKLDAQHGGRREDWFGGLVALGGGGSLWKPAAVAAAALALASGGAVTAAAWRGGDPDEGSAGSSVAAAMPADMSALSSGGGARAAAPPIPVRGERAATGPAAAECALTLLRADDELPLAQVEVSSAAESRTSDDSGTVRLPWPAGDGGLAVRVAATAATREADFHLAEPGRHVLRVPRRGGRLSGRVLDLEGLPVPQAEVRCFDHLEAGRAVDWRSPARSARADARGEFELLDLADARGRIKDYRVLASAPDHFAVHAVTARIGAGHETRALLVLEPAVEVAGRVSAWDRPRVPGAPLLAYPRNSQSYERAVELLERSGERWARLERYPALYVEADEAGEFRLPLTAEPWHVQVDHPGYPRWTGWLEEPGFVDVRLEAGLALSGRVLDAAGAAVPEATVKLYAKDERAALRTGPDGGFRFEALSPLEGALVAVTAAGHSCTVVPVDLVAGETALAVRLEPERAVTGRVVDAAGEPLAGEQVEIRGDRVVATEWIPRQRGTTWEQLASPPRWRTHTDAEGRFEFRGLYPGEFRVKTGQSRTASAWARVPAGGPPLVLVDGDLSAALTVRGSARLPTGEVAGLVHVLLQPYVEGESEPRLDPAGNTFLGERFELAGLDPGRWRLEVRAQDQTAAWTGPIQDLGPGLHIFDVELEPLAPAGRRRRQRASTSPTRPRNRARAASP